jgi:predicted MFS family arabinose efflux permease
MKKSWIISTISILMGIAFAISMFKVPPVMGAIMKEYAINVTQAGMLITAVGLTALIMSFPAGIIIQKVGIRLVAIFAMCFALAGNLLGIIASSYSILLVARFIEGVGYGCVGLIVPAIIAAWFPAEKRGLPMAIWSLWVSIGMLLILNISNVISPSFGWKGNWWFTTILFAVIFVLFVLIVKMPAGGQVENEAQAPAGEKPSTMEGIKAPGAWLLGIIFTVYSFGYGAYSGFYPIYLKQSLGMDTAAANTATSVASITLIISGILIGFLLNKIPNTRHADLMVVATVVTGVLIVGQFCMPSTSFVIPFMLIFGLFMQGVPPIAFSMAPDASATPATMPITMGIIMLGMNIGGSFGTVICGAFVDSYGWSAIMIPLGVLAVIGIVCSLIFRQIMKKKRLALA